VVKSLWLNTSLTDLNLQMNPIKYKGGVAVGSALCYTTTLTALEVKGCALGDIGGQAIFDALKHDAAPDAEELPQGHAPPQRLPPHPRRRRQRHRRRVLPEHRRRPRHQPHEKSQRGYKKLLSVSESVIRMTRGLERLHLSANRIGAPGASALATALARGAALLALDTSANALGDAGAARVGGRACAATPPSAPSPSSRPSPPSASTSTRTSTT
jgi:Ran GTPase-activating protein (RanGAP) involved in mRNA processing and transport